MKQKALLGALVLFTILTRLPFAIEMPALHWDGAAYALNAQTFAGQGTYSELLRSPLMSTLMSPFSGTELTFYLTPIVLSALSIITCFLLFKEISDDRTAIAGAAIIAFSAMFFHYSSRLLLESGILLFSSVSILAFLKAKENKKLMPAAFFLASIMVLFKYSLALLAGILIAWIIWTKRPGKKVLIKSALCFVLPLVPWLIFNQISTGNALQSFTQAFTTYTQDAYRYKSLEFYFKNATAIANTLTWLLFLAGAVTAIKEKKEKELLVLSWFVLLVLALFTQGVKEVRYMVPALLPIAFFAGKKIRKLKKIGVVLLVVIALTNFAWIQHSLKFAPTDDCVNPNGIKQAGKYLQENSQENASVYTNNWPVTAFYSRREVDKLWATVNQTWFEKNLKKHDYLLVQETSPLTAELNEEKIVLLEEHGPENCRTKLYKVKK